MAVGDVNSVCWWMLVGAGRCWWLFLDSLSLSPRKKRRFSRVPDRPSVDHPNPTAPNFFSILFLCQERERERENNTKPPFTFGGVCWAAPSGKGGFIIIIIIMKV